MEPALDPPAPESDALRSRGRQFLAWASTREAVVFLAFTIFFLLYGVVPIFGGDGLGLVGADEPRYAQIAHEMLVRFDSAHTLKGKLRRLRHALSLRPSLA